MRFALPLLIFLGLGVLLFLGLGNDPRHVPSPLVGKPAPEFNLPDLMQADRNIQKSDLLGQVYLLNVWASWCYACRIEHPEIERIARQGQLPVIGLNYKDKPEDAKRWLEQFGNPYQMIIADESGRTSIDFGVYGAPETFIVDQQGLIQYKHVGPVDRKVYESILLPKILELQNG